MPCALAEVLRVTLSFNIQPILEHAALAHARQSPRTQQRVPPVSHHAQHQLLRLAPSALRGWRSLLCTPHTQQSRRLSDIIGLVGNLLAV